MDRYELAPYQRNEQTAEQVFRMAQVGASDRDIAYILGLPFGELVQNYRNELDTGRAHLRARLNAKQTELALQGSERMLVWLGKQLLGQRDTPTNDHDPDGFEDRPAERIIYRRPQEIHNDDPDDITDDSTVQDVSGGEE